MVIVGDEPSALVGLVHLELFQGEVAIDIGHHVIAVVGLQGFIDDNQIAVANADIYQGIARDARQEGGFVMADEFLVKSMLSVT